MSLLFRLVSCTIGTNGTNGANGVSGTSGASDTSNTDGHRVVMPPCGCVYIPSNVARAYPMIREMMLHCVPEASGHACDHSSSSDSSGLTEMPFTLPLDPVALNQAVQYMANRLQNTAWGWSYLVLLPTESLFELINAALFLQAQDTLLVDLHELMALRIAQKDAAAMAAFFNLVHDVTEQDFETIETDNAYLSVDYYDHTA